MLAPTHTPDSRLRIPIVWPCSAWGSTTASTKQAFPAKPPRGNAPTLVPMATPNAPVTKGVTILVPPNLVEQPGVRGDTQQAPVWITVEDLSTTNLLPQLHSNNPIPFNRSRRFSKEPASSVHPDSRRAQSTAARVNSNASIHSPTSMLAEAVLRLEVRVFAVMI
jgi:hypothetical protein